MIRKEILIPITVLISSVLLIQYSQGQTKSKENTITALEKYWTDNCGIGGKMNVMVADTAKGNSILQKYYREFSNAKKLKEEKGHPGNYELYEVERIVGALSGDKTCLVFVKQVYLSPRVDGKEKAMEPEWGVYELPLYDELICMNANLKVLWKKRYNWNGKASSNAYIRKVSKNGNKVMVLLPDTSASDDRADWPVSIIYDKAGKEVFKYYVSATTRGPEMTNNGKYYYWGERITYTFKEIWTIHDSEQNDSIKITCTIGQDDPPDVFEDGKILVRSAGNKKTWYMFE